MPLVAPRSLRHAIDGERPPAVPQVEEALWEYHGLYFVVFAYYACLGGDVSFIYFNQWAQFIQDCDLANNRSKYCKKADIDRLCERLSKHQHAAPPPQGRAPPRALHGGRRSRCRWSGGLRSHRPRWHAALMLDVCMRWQSSM